MNPGKAIQWAEFFVALTIGIATLLFSLFILGDGQSLNNFHINAYGRTQLLFFLSNGYQTTLLTILLFAAIIIISTAWYVSRSTVRLKSREDQGELPVSLAFLFIYLVITVIGSFEPSAVHVEEKMGKLALALNYGQIVILFSAFLFALTLVFSPLWSREKSMKSFLNGASLPLRGYGKAVIPALIFAIIFYVFLGAGILTSLEFFGVFVLLEIFAQRYGIIMSIFLLVISLGSNVISVTFTSFTGIFYPIIIFLFAFIGLLTGFMTNVTYQKKAMEKSAKEQQDLSDKTTGDTGYDNNEVLQPTDTPSRLKDSREMADQLFIRGVCPNCDSVEFYVKSGGELHCKKCKSIWSGNEVEFNSFKVGRDKKFRH